MNQKCLFDTNIVIYDFFLEEELETYNTENTDIVPMISLYVKEEILHKLAAHDMVRPRPNNSTILFKQQR